MGREIQRENTAEGIATSISEGMKNRQTKNSKRASAQKSIELSKGEVLKLVLFLTAFEDDIDTHHGTNAGIQAINIKENRHIGFAQMYKMTQKLTWPYNKSVRGVFKRLIGFVHDVAPHLKASWREVGCATIRTSPKQDNRAG